jgi:ribulose-phosphate 3-epimerase
MTVFPGFGGQAFMPEVVEKIAGAARLKREHRYRYVIEVDGGIKPDNAASVRDAGGQILVAGTAVFRSEDYAGAIRAIRG